MFMFKSTNLCVYLLDSLKKTYIPYWVTKIQTKILQYPTRRNF
jgi:hypothetical protein